MSRDLYEQDVVRRVLALREDLVRHDENWKAWLLMDQCVPYFLRDTPAIRQAHDQQKMMVAHALDEREYLDYYAENPHERPFERQYGIEPEQAADYLRRVAFAIRMLNAHLAAIGGTPGELRIIDLACNDGWMAQCFHQFGFALDGIDLNPSCIERAMARKEAHDLAGGFEVANISTAGPDADDLEARYDVSIAFEVIEHVPSPVEFMHDLSRWTKPGGMVLVSTPDGAVEGGDLPDWDKVESKGHLHALTREDMQTLGGLIGDVEVLAPQEDGTICMALTTSPEEEPDE